MDRDYVLRLCVSCGSIVVALACLGASVVMEIRDVRTPPFIAGLAGTALGVLSSALTGLGRGESAPPKSR